MENCSNFRTFPRKRGLGARERAMAAAAEREEESATSVGEKRKAVDASPSDDAKTHAPSPPVSAALGQALEPPLPPECPVLPFSIPPPRSKPSIPRFAPTFPRRVPSVQTTLAFVAPSEPKEPSEPKDPAPPPSSPTGSPAERETAAAMERTASTASTVILGPDSQERSSQPQAPLPAALPPLPPKPKWKGLDNYGNTCYVNVIIQALFFCPGFADLLSTFVDLTSHQLLEEKDRHIRRPLPATVGLVGALNQLLKCMQPDATLPLQPSLSKFLSEMRACDKRFAGGRQQDAQEFLNFLLLALHTTELEFKKPPPPPTPVSAEVRSLNSNNNNNNSALSDTASDDEPALHDLKRMKTDPPPSTTTATTTTTTATTPSPSVAPPLARALSVGAAPIAPSQPISPKAEEKQPNNNNTTSPPSESRTLVSEMFEGKLELRIKCLECECASARPEPFLDLSLSLLGNRSARTLELLLQDFFHVERLNGRDKFFCDTCHAKTEARKGYVFAMLPPILTLHLKRFSYESQRKICTHLTPPLETSFETYFKEPVSPILYRLYAIVFHAGYYANSGHYRCVIRERHQWFLFDDEDVTQLTDEELRRLFPADEEGSSSNTAYLLFYHRSDLIPPSASEELDAAALLSALSPPLESSDAVMADISSSLLPQQHSSLPPSVAPPESSLSSSIPFPSQPPQPPPAPSIASPPSATPVEPPLPSAALPPTNHTPQAMDTTESTPTLTTAAQPPPPPPPSSPPPSEPMQTL